VYEVEIAIEKMAISTSYISSAFNELAYSSEFQTGIAQKWSLQKHTNNPFF
jgi:hypothetical protein